jgi:predicted CoA-substrate-specific enzyme activase
VLVLGIDLGAVGIKAALLGTGDDAEPVSWLRGGSNLWDPVSLSIDLPRIGPSSIVVATYRRTRGRPVEAAGDLLGEIREDLGGRPLDGVRATGSGSALLRSLVDFTSENEFRALATATWAIAPEARTLFEIGGESSKMLLFERDAASGDLGIADYQTNGDCAAGTGSFLDQQAGRLRYEIEQVGRIAAGAERTAKIAGRCSVFAKSDMIHAQQKGYLPPEVLRGLCETVARNFRAAVAKGKHPRPPVLFVGGVAANEMVVHALREAFELADDLVIPAHAFAHGAIGCAVRAALDREPSAAVVRRREAGTQETGAIPSARPLSMGKVLTLRDRVIPFEMPESGPPVEVTIGIDIGSVSTNVVLLDNTGCVVKEIYTRTQARPVEVVTAALAQVREEFGDRIVVRGVGTTGSGRELIGELVGADTINDEITAHKTGATFIARTMLDCEVNTIFEIGGQDAKFIRIDDGIVVDFAMNEACAAGTGSFLEERAEELGVCIKDEFALRALASQSPVRLGERCTVFMERDVNAYQQRGAQTNDLLAGLALSVATNYINRVVRGRRIDGTIFFQGGTAYNDAVAAAFAQILDREIVVPPYNGVVGAVGAALLARDKMLRVSAGTRFRGWDLGAVEHTIREFTCRGCENRCEMQEFRVEDEKTYWGDQCGDRYRRRAKVDFRPVIDDLVRLRKEWLLDGYDPDFEGRRGRIVIPRAMYFHDRFPYWNAFFRALDYGVRTTPETNRGIAVAGVEAAVAEPCFPIQIAHGQIAKALELDPTAFVWLPNYINSEATHREIQSFFCPWGTTLPFIVRGAETFEEHADRILHPLIRFRGGRQALVGPLHEALGRGGIRKGEIARALVAAEQAHDRFRRRILEAGVRALERLAETGEPAVLLVGRPYNLFDPIASLDVARKLRDLYGVNVLPLEFLPADDSDIEAINANMYWGYGRKILAAARAAGVLPNLHMIYVTNFKCGPDSYIKHFVRDAYGRPFLSLQFDGHANDAGMLTRIEAYLDSQGILRRWGRSIASMTAAPPDDATVISTDAGRIDGCSVCSGTPGCKACLDPS